MNCLRTFPILGHICWGARTLDGADQLASEWKYIPIRRLALFIEESLFRGTKWVVFEPMSDSSRNSASRLIGMYFHSLASWSAPSSVRAPQQRAVDRERAQAVDAERVERAVLQIGQEVGEACTFSSRALGAGGRLPDAARGIGSREETRHRAGRGDAPQPLPFAESGHERAREVDRGVRMRRRRSAPARSASPSSVATGSGMSTIRNARRDAQYPVAA